MKFTIEKRDLFTVPKDYALCHCISADFALGAGIAKLFAERGVKNELIEIYCRDNWDGHGFALYTEATAWKKEYNLVTKALYYQKPTLKTLIEALEDMRGYLPLHGVKKIAMPKIGCGLDRLKWSDVENIIRELFAETDVEILVCDWR